MAELQDDLRVSLDAFEGPLDLLLYLIRRAEVDVTDIAIAQITDQYLAFIRQIDDVDVELAGEFLVMAATLIEIKAKTIAPPERVEGAGEGDSRGDGGDPRADLIQQLLAYQRFRLAAEELESRRQRHDARRPRHPSRSRRRDDGAESMDAAELEAKLAIELEDVHPMDLAEAMLRLASTIDFARLGSHIVQVDDTPIELHEADLIDRLTGAGKSSPAGTGALTLQEIFDGRDRTQRVGLFLALLELVRTRRIAFTQEQIDAPISLRLRAENEEDQPVEGEDPALAAALARRRRGGHDHQAPWLMGESSSDAGADDRDEIEEDELERKIREIRLPE